VSSTEVQIKKILATRIGKDVQNRHNLSEDLGLDSLDTVEVIIDVEMACQVVIPDQETKRFKRVQDIIDYVDAQRC
jgi:acyl carrier protein